MQLAGGRREMRSLSPPSAQLSSRCPSKPCSRAATRMETRRSSKAAHGWGMDTVAHSEWQGTQSHLQGAGQLPCPAARRPHSEHEPVLGAGAGHGLLIAAASLRLRH